MNPNLPRLELFMPFYGDQKYFEAAIESVRLQSNSNWFLTVVDDCYPTREAGEYIDSLNDSRIRYLRNENNIGISANFQQCVDLAKAPFFTVMGCDDVLLPDYFERMLQLIDLHPTAAFIQPGVVVIDENGHQYWPLGDKVKAKIRNKFPNRELVGGEEVAASLALGCWTYFPSIVWQTCHVQQNPFREDFRIVLDLALQFDLLAAGGNMLIDDVPAFAYRRHRNSASMASAIEGSRFIEEFELLAESAIRFKQIGWTSASKSATLHLTSRLNLAIAVAQRLFKGKLSDAWGLSRIFFRREDLPAQVD